MLHTLLLVFLLMNPVVSFARPKAADVELTESEKTSMAELAIDPASTNEPELYKEEAPTAAEAADAKEPVATSKEPEHEMTDLEMAKVRARPRPWAADRGVEGSPGVIPEKAKKSNRAPTAVVDLQNVIELDPAKRKAMPAARGAVSADDLQVQMKPRVKAAH